jgi:hypothetical protein
MHSPLEHVVRRIEEMDERFRRALIKALRAFPQRLAGEGIEYVDIDHLMRWLINIVAPGAIADPDRPKMTTRRGVPSQDFHVIVLTPNLGEGGLRRTGAPPPLRIFEKRSRTICVVVSHHQRRPGLSATGA